MIDSPIRIGTRGSRLALAQARLVADALARDGGSTTDIVVVETEGDRRAPDTAWGEGAFVAAIERALLSGRVDVAVHSAKDIPTDTDDRLTIAAYLPRADPRDALVVRGDVPARLDELPRGARVGTDSPRRTGFLRAKRPDLVVRPLHGNVDTRLRRLDEGESDALVLACAGLDRIGLGERIGERLDAQIVPPAPGQGALAVQVRRDDTRVLGLAIAIDDHPTRVCVEAERTFLAASGGGCRAPIGALAEVRGDRLTLLGGYASADGSTARIARTSGSVADAATLARELIRQLALGASPGIRSRRVLVARARGQAAGLASALREAGLEPLVVPTIAVEPVQHGGDLDRAVTRLDGYDLVVVTSANGARAIVESAERAGMALGTVSWAAIGAASRSVLEDAGCRVVAAPSRASSAVLAEEISFTPGDAVLLVRGDLADGALPRGLRARGARVDEVTAYRTVEAPDPSRTLLRDALAEGSPDAVVFTSGSTVRGLVALARAGSLDVSGIPAVCIGPDTAEHARRAGFRVLAISADTRASALAAATARALGVGHEATR
jgi:hydroxymethylbilane synthase